MLHLARSRGFRTFHLHWNGHEDNIDSELRNIMKRRTSLHKPAAMQGKHANNTINNSRYLPGFEDKCTFPGYERYSNLEGKRPNPEIAVAEHDFVGLSFRSIAIVADFLNISTVVLMGMHTNMCIRSVAMYLQMVNVSAVYVDGLLDSAYYHQGQVEHGSASHTANNDVTFQYATTYHGWGTRVYELMRSLMTMRPIAKEPKWVMYPDAARQFRRYYYR
jgi:hypothetical protein